MSRFEAIIQRDKVLEIIDLDLANVTQIFDTYFETMNLPDKDKDFLVKQIERMSKLITESRTIVGLSTTDDELINELIQRYKSTRVRNNNIDLEEA